MTNHTKCWYIKHEKGETHAAEIKTENWFELDRLYQGYVNKLVGIFFWKLKLTIIIKNL